MEKKRLWRRYFIGLFFCFALFLMGHQTEAKQNITVVIDPGHGGSGVDNEAELGAIYHDKYEKEMTLEIAKAMKEELEQYSNLTVVLTREEDRGISLEERAQIAAQVGGDILISLHLNASLGHEMYGAEIWTSAFGEYYAAGRGLGETFLKELTELGLADRSIKTKLSREGNDYYGIIRHGVSLGIPTIIVEHGHMDSKDWEYMDSQEKLRELGKRDANAVAKYYGLKKNVYKAKVEPTVIVETPLEPVLPDTTDPDKVELILLDYDRTTGIAHFELSAVEEESKLMYYAISTDAGKEWGELTLWPKDTGTVSIEMDLGKDFDKEVVAKVYNNYEGNTESNPLKISPYLEEEVKEEEKAADPVSEDSILPLEEKEPVERIEESLPILDAPVFEEFPIPKGNPIEEKKTIETKAELPEESTSREEVYLLLGAVTAGILVTGILIVMLLWSRTIVKRKKRERQRRIRMGMETFEYKVGRRT